MTKRKVLMVCSVFYPEPIVSARLQTDLAEELSKTCDVTVLRTRPTRPYGFKMPDYNISQYSFKEIILNSYTCPESSLIGRFRESYSMGRTVSKYIDKHHDEIDFIYNDAWHLFGVGMVAKRAVKYNIPYITPIQDIYPESLISKLPQIKPLQWLAMNLLMPIDLYNQKHAAKIHTNSEKMMLDLATSRKLPQNKFIVVRNWQNEQEFVEYTESHQGSEPHEKFTFMYMGNVGPLAGIETLFEALRIANISNARLVVAGSGSAKENLQEKAKQYTDCNIEFWDVPTGMVPATQFLADVMCLPVMKGFALSSVPSKLPAYMFSAKPVLAAVDAGSDTAKCIKESHGGWVADAENPDSIAKYMREAYNTSKDRLVRMGKDGFDYSIANFSRKQNLDKLTEACLEIINK